MSTDRILSRRDWLMAQKTRKIILDFLVKTFFFIFRPKKSKMAKNSQKMTKNDQKNENFEKKFLNFFLVRIDLE